MVKIHAKNGQADLVAFNKLVFRMKYKFAVNQLKLLFKMQQDLILKQANVLKMPIFVVLKKLPLITQYV